MTRTIELYGRLREAGAGAAVELELKEGATASQALAALREKLGPKAALLDGAVLATDAAVLTAGDSVPEGRLAALPPVCGG